MRKHIGAMLLGTGATLVGAAALAGCDTYFFMGSDPYWLAQACEDGGTDCFAQSTTSGPTCDGDPTQDASLVKDDCGVFVKPGATGGDGTMASPFGTFAEAAKSSSAWVFACEGDYAETEAVVFGGDVAVYGGFTGCDAAWKWSADAKAKIAGPADVIAVTLTGGTSLVTNVDVTAADAVKEGGSSIAVLVNGGTVEIRNGELTSGAAKAGVVGESLGADQALNGLPGVAGAATCDAGGSHPGPAGATNTCGDGSTSVAGSGGGGFLLPASAASGTDGIPAPDPNPSMKGIGGVGEGVSGATECSSGTDGATGGNGNAASAVTGLGDVMETGYTGVPGIAGTYGKPGQGGGGGGGAKGASMINCGMGNNDFPGASGGAGGTGGCGGKGGGGGGAGGASIVLLSLTGDVTLTSVNLHPGGGGNGGVGGNGQGGGSKGTGGSYGAGLMPAAKDSCRGGDGGSGGTGGPGSGGTGGHTVGIAFKGTLPKGGTVVMDKATLGIGGDGGTGNEAAGKGSDGLACKTLDFVKGADSCVP